MGLRSKAASSAGAKVGPKVGWSFVRQVLDKAIDGVGPLRSAADSAADRLVDAQGDVERAVESLIRVHTGLAGAQGFVTNIGGLATTTVGIPANVAGVALVQCHLVAGIAHLRGYDLDEPRVRNAILACMLGRDTVEALVRSKRLPAPPMALATSPAHDPELDKRIATEVTSELISRTLGRRAVTLVARRVPLVGGAVAGGTDGWATWQVGHYAADELRDRRFDGVSA